MKTCPNCNLSLNDEAVFCPACGAPLSSENPPPASFPSEPYDHTYEFDPADIAQNKLFAMLSYLGILVIIPLFAVKGSPYTDFHVRQGLKLLIIQSVATLLTVLLSWTVIFAFVGLAAEVAVIILGLMGVFSVGNNKAKDLPVIRSIKFFN